MLTQDRARARRWTLRRSQACLTPDIASLGLVQCGRGSSGWAGRRKSSPPQLFGRKEFGKTSLGRRAGSTLAVRSLPAAATLRQKPWCIRRRKECQSSLLKRAGMITKRCCRLRVKTCSPVFSKTRRRDPSDRPRKWALTLGP